MSALCYYVYRNKDTTNKKEEENKMVNTLTNKTMMENKLYNDKMWGFSDEDIEPKHAIMEEYNEQGTFIGYKLIELEVK